MYSCDYIGKDKESLLSYKDKELYNTFFINPDLSSFAELDYVFYCVICRGVLIIPVRTECGHRMCKECLDVEMFNIRLAKLYNRIIKYKCPLQYNDCCDNITEESVKYDYSLVEEIPYQYVFCKYRNNGCDIKMQLRNLKDHVEICTYKDIGNDDDANANDNDNDNDTDSGYENKD